MGRPLFLSMNHPPALAAVDTAVTSRLVFQRPYVAVESALNHCALQSMTPTFVLGDEAK